MSNRKNKNSKTNQTTGNSHNDFNSFRIEALEPRLLMSATAAEWQAEFSTVESIVSGAESGLNHDVDNIAA